MSWKHIWAASFVNAYSKSISTVPDSVRCRGGTAVLEWKAHQMASAVDEACEVVFKIEENVDLIEQYFGIGSKEMEMVKCFIKED